MTLRHQAFSGIRWTTLSSLGRSILQIGQVVILARLLVPSEFGIMAIVLAIMAFLQIFADAGVSNAVIHFQDITKEQLSSLFWLNVGISTLVAGLLVSFSPLIAYWYSEPVLTNLLILAAIGLIFASLGQQLRFKAQKELQFARLAKSELCAALCAFLTAVSLAWYGAGVYALSIAGVVNSAVTSFMAWCLLAQGWRPHWRLRFDEIRQFLSFGAYMVGNNLANTFNSQIDVLLGARFLGANALGLYSVPKNLTLNVQSVINPIVTQVGFPIMAKAQDDAALLNRIYLQTMRMTASVNFPIYIGLYFFSPFIVDVVLGSKWISVIPIFQTLSIWGLLRSIGNPVGSLLFAKGKANLAFQWNLALLFFTGPTVWVGSYFGAQGIAIAVTSLMAVLFVPNWYFLVKPICGATFNDYVRQFASPLFASLIAVYFAYLLSIQISNSFVHLIVGVGIGAVLYLIVSYFINRVWLDAMYELIFKRSPLWASHPEK